MSAPVPLGSGFDAALPLQLNRDRGASREYFRRVEEPSGLGRLRHAGPFPLPASRARL